MWRKKTSVASEKNRCKLVSATSFFPYICMYTLEAPHRIIISATARVGGAKFFMNFSFPLVLISTTHVRVCVSLSSRQVSRVFCTGTRCCSIIRSFFFFLHSHIRVCECVKKKGERLYRENVVTRDLPNTKRSSFFFCCSYGYISIHLLLSLRRRVYITLRRIQGNNITRYSSCSRSK